MRISAFTAAVFMLLTPFTASAATPSLDALCKGNTGNPSDAGTLFDQTGDASIMDTFLKKKVLCPSACFDIALTISVVDQKLKIVTAAVDKCTNPKTDPKKIQNVFSPLDKPNDTRNCASGVGLPSISATTIPLDSGTAAMAKMFGYSIPDALSKVKKVGPKSRCDQKVTDVISSFTSNGNNGLDVGLNQLAGLSNPSQAPVPNDASGDSDPKPNGADASGPSAPSPASGDPYGNVAKPAQVPTDTEGLAMMLREKYGVPEDQAKTLAENNTDQVKSMIEKTYNNDKEGAQAIAKELKLNDDVMKNIAQMTPAQQITIDQARDIANQQQQPNSQQQPNTFDQNTPTQSNNGLPTQCGIPGTEGLFARAESVCGQQQVSTTGCSGLYHFCASTWTRYARETGFGQYADPAYRNDPDISTQVLKAKNALIEQQYGATWDAAGLPRQVGLYACHVMGEGGCASFTREYLNNPNASSEVLRTQLGTCGGQYCFDINRSVYVDRSGSYRTLAQVGDEMNRRMGVGGSIIPNIASNGSPFTGITGGAGVYNNGGSPFGGASLFNFGTGSSYPTGYSTPTSYPASGGGSIGSFFTGMFSGRTPQQAQVPSQQNQVQYPTQQGQGVASIIAQPTSTYVGGNVLVSWSSVGTRTDQPCQTNLYSKNGTTTIGTSNEGSRVITATSSGTMSFTIICNTYAGTIIAQSTVVQVQ